MGRVAHRKPPAQTPTGVDWSTCASAVREYDSSIVEAWRRDMDNSITFAALFCVVVAAFLSQSYKWPQDLVFNKTAGTIINAAFFSSLVISLNAVVMATLVKQWLAEYTWALESRSGSSQEILALRQVRFNGLNKWKLPQIIDYLPLQIIFAVFLFFGGVAYLAWTLDVVVGLITSILVGASGMFFIATSILPTFYPESFSRSPQAWLVHHARISIQNTTSSSRKEISDWSQILMEHVKAVDSHPEIDALYWIHSVLASWDPKLLPSIWNCAVSLDSSSLAANAVCTLYRHTASHTVGDKNLFTVKQAEVFCKDIPQGETLLASGHKALLKAFPSRVRPAAFAPAIPHGLVDYALFLASTVERVPYANDDVKSADLLNVLLCLLGLFDPQITPLTFLMPSERRAFDERFLSLLSHAFEECTHWTAYIEGDEGVLLFQTTLSGCSDTDSEAFPFLSALSVLLYASQYLDQFNDDICRLLKDMRNSLSKGLDLASESTNQKLGIWTKMLERHARDSTSPFDEEGLVRLELHALLQQMDAALVFEPYTSRTRRNLYAMVMAWGTPSMITMFTIAKVDALINSGQSLNEVESSYWSFSINDNAEAGVTDVLLDATGGKGKTTGEEDRILIALCFMMKESYKSERSLPSAISTLRHVIKRISCTESPHAMEAFVLAVRSFTQKEYAAQGDSTRYNCITVPDSLRGQLVACMEELFGLAQHLSSKILLGIYVLRLSALTSRVHRIPPRLASTAVPNEAERTCYLIELDKAVQEYASSRTEEMDEAFSQEVLTVFKEIEAGGVSMAQKRVIERARAYVQTR
ncbi:hypothetical protein MVEN_02548700 [Mycena venus]|uniref:DUF6535 domain-containing protein n=1 Tax=Mycena venus TaxID=2733690 RepID=A0A8H6TZH6_9AGAR|nr:hypothetical protein MVEN_02548700 [Mycena venus]